MKKLIVLQAAILILFCGIAPSFGQEVSEEAQRYFARGMAAVKMAKSQDDYAAAIKEFESAVRLAPHWPKAWFNLGVVQKEAGKTIGAIASLKKYIELAPDAPNAATVKTMLYEFEYKVEQEAGELLIAKGVNIKDIDAKDKDGNTPLRNAVYQNNFELTEMLITKGADINVKDDYGETPLHLATIRGQRKMVEILINKGADINAENKYGKTPLYFAFFQNKIDLVELLITKGANQNFKGMNAWTLMHYAANKGFKEIVELLITKGSDINAKNAGGDTPLDYAELGGFTEVAELLKIKGAKYGNSHEQKYFLGFRLIEIILLIVLYILIWLIAFADILKNDFKKNTKRSWLFLIFLVPILGLLCYFLIGFRHKIRGKIN